MLVQLAESDAQILECFSTLSQLRPHIKQKTFLEQIHRQQQQYGYQLAFIKEDIKVPAVAGFHICESLSWGKFLYVFDLIVDENSRSLGYGKNLFTWLVEYAKSNNCDELHLDSGVQRFDAHRFYFRERMKISSHHFYLPLSD